MGSIRHKLKVLLVIIIIIKFPYNALSDRLKQLFYQETIKRLMIKLALKSCFYFGGLTNLTQIKHPFQIAQTLRRRAICQEEICFKVTNVNNSSVKTV